MSAPQASATIGAMIEQNQGNGDLDWVLTLPEAWGLFENDSNLAGHYRFKFKMMGWQRYGELRKESSESRLAFMAMKFDPEMISPFEHCFKPAVAEANFELRRLVDGQPAGSIDDQLRVALRRSRLVLTDLTHKNNGAYWEAGFAEGLGRPVIYTCRKVEWELEKTHFDTNHLATIIWDPEDLDDARHRLTAMIRATLPLEARLTDISP